MIVAALSFVAVVTFSDGTERYSGPWPTLGDCEFVAQGLEIDTIEHEDMGATARCIPSFADGRDAEEDSQ